MSDPIADMLTRIRNAVAMKKEFVEFPSSKMKTSVLSVMKKKDIYQISLQQLIIINLRLKLI